MGGCRDLGASDERGSRDSVAATNMGSREAFGSAVVVEGGVSVSAAADRSLVVLRLVGYGED